MFELKKHYRSWSGNGQAAPGAEKTKTWANFRHAAAQSKTPQKIRSRLVLNEMTTDAADMFC